ncbi:hypothetical protein GCM10023160_33240 [Brachybacterium paraconglomeratum]
MAVSGRELGALGVWTLTYHREQLPDILGAALGVGICGTIRPALVAVQRVVVPSPVLSFSSGGR